LTDISEGKLFEDTIAAQLITTAENWQEKAPEDYSNEMLNLQKTAITASQVATTADINTITGKGKSSIDTIAEIMTSQENQKTERQKAVTTASSAIRASANTSSMEVRNGFEGVK
jgi:hypothetical protein